MALILRGEAILALYSIRGRDAFATFMHLKNPDGIVSLVIWSRVITSLPRCRRVVKSGQQCRMCANGY
jgi:hypothetical protein